MQWLQSTIIKAATIFSKQTSTQHAIMKGSLTQIELLFTNVDLLKTQKILSCLRHTSQEDQWKLLLIDIDAHLI